MSNMKIISILDHDQRQQEVKIKSERDQVIAELREVLRSETEVEVQRLRNRIQDLTLRVTVLEGGNPPP